VAFTVLNLVALRFLWIEHRRGALSTTDLEAGNENLEESIRLHPFDPSAPDQAPSGVPGSPLSPTRRMSMEAVNRDILEVAGLLRRNDSLRAGRASIAFARDSSPARTPRSPRDSIDVRRSSLDT